jgi:hypothetical protein
LPSPCRTLPLLLIAWNQASGGFTRMRRTFLFLWFLAQRRLRAKRSHRRLPRRAGGRSITLTLKSSVG